MPNVEFLFLNRAEAGLAAHGRGDIVLGHAIHQRALAEGAGQRLTQWRGPDE